MYIKKICDEELAHVIMEAENSHDLLGKFSVSLEEGPRTREADDINTSLRAGENKGRCPSSISEIQKKKGMNFSFLRPFVLVRPSTDWMLPTHFGEGDLLYKNPLGVSHEPQGGVPWNSERDQSIL